MAKLSERRTKEYAAIAQSVERILGKDEVASSNLASSSKPLKLLEFQGFFLFLSKSNDLILHIKILIRDEVIIMKKIEMPIRESKNFLEVFEMFVISQAAKGVSDITIRNYRYHMKNISRSCFKFTSRSSSLGTVIIQPYFS